MGTKRKSVDIEACNSCESLQTDLKVKIEGRSFKFNKVLTDAISHFYRESSNMIENISDNLHEINLSAESFDEFLYTVPSFRKCINPLGITIPGFSKYEENLGSTENHLELWEAVRVMKIPSLIRNCETKVGQIISEDNFERIYAKANHYKSDIVLCRARKYLDYFFMNNYNKNLTLILTYEDLFRLIKRWPFHHDEMQDTVLRSIFEWAENVDDQGRPAVASKDDVVMPTQKRRKYENKAAGKKVKKVQEELSMLSKILKASKINSASIGCLEELSKHPLCEQDHEAKLIVNKAINYKLDRNTHGYWPPDALYGNSLGYRHIGVLADNDRVSALVLGQRNWIRFPRCPLHTKITNLTVFDNELYVVSSTGLESLIFVYRKKEWTFLLDLPNKDYSVVSKGSFIYVIDGTCYSVKCVSPRETPVLHSEIKFPVMMRNPESALDFDKSILIFCSIDSDDRATVMCLEVPEHKWTDCGYLEGSAKNMVGFRNETMYFILQRDGSISQVKRKQDNSIEFLLIKRLWSIQNTLRGAFIYRDVLYIFSNTPMESSCLRGVSGMFREIEYWYQEEEAGNFVQYYIPVLDICRSEKIRDTQISLA
ncbi:kelch-like protein 8 [Biomphalaria glabrata]|nr:kelch-like protein 8 [Biomphalaria glabrata]